MLDAGGLDGVLIAAPSELHLETVTAVAAAGLPILCEKPCGVTRRRCARGGRPSLRHGVPLQVALLAALRAGPPGAAGADRSGRDRRALSRSPASSGTGGRPAPRSAPHSGGIFVDMGVHEFDQLRWLTGQEFGEIRAVGLARRVGAGRRRATSESAQVLAIFRAARRRFVSLGRRFPGGRMSAASRSSARRMPVRCDFLWPPDGEQRSVDALVPAGRRLRDVSRRAGR